MRRVRVAMLGVLLIALLGFPATAGAATGDLVFYSGLSGDAEVPSVDTDGTGSVYVIVNAARTKLTYVATFRGLSGPVVAAHIHFGASDVAGPVIIPLRAGRSPMIGTLYASNLTPAGGIDTFAEAITAMLAGDTYVNLHTAANPPGEVRGQLKRRSGDRVFTGTLSGAAEVPAVSGEGTGSALVIVNNTGTKVTYVVTFRGLSGPVVAAHIHLGDPSVSGPVVLPLRAGRSPMVGTLYAANVTPAGDVANLADLIAAMRGFRTYVNLHTAANPAGEVRANLR